MTPNQANRELELKFRAEQRDLQRFKKAVNAVGGNRRAWPQKSLVSRYFDTPDLRMQKLGIAVRLRTSAGKSVQTVKARKGGTGGLMDRHEWEHPVPEHELDLALLPTQVRRAMGEILNDELSPVAEVHIERQTMLIRRQNPVGPNLVIEAVADKGRAVAAGRSEPFCECELELIEGDVNSFLHVASEIHSACALPLSSLTKSARGYRLFTGEAPRVYRVPKFNLTRDQTIHQAMGEIFPTCIGNIVENQDACLDGSDPEGVHQMRVSVRRLRTSLKVFQNYLNPARVVWMADDLKWLGSTLGPARDWDVYITEMLHRVEGYGVDAAAIAALRDAAEQKCKQAYDTVRKTLRSARYAKMIFRLTAFAAVEGWLAMPLDPDDLLLKPLGDSATGILAKPHRKLIRQANGLADQDMEARHEVRIRLKKLRYAVDFLRGIFPGSETRKYMKNLQKLQDQFGHLNDVALTLRLTAELALPTKNDVIDDKLLLAGGLVQGWYACALHEAGPKLIKNWETFAAEPPFWKSP